MIKKIKQLLNIEDEDSLLEEIIELTKSKVLFHIKEKEIPKELEFVVIELSITRYNRIGSEGLKSESIEGRIQTYESDLDDYKPIFEDYLNSKKKSKKVRFL